MQQLKLSNELGGAGGCLRKGARMGRTFAFGVGASLCPFTGLDRIAFCVADARQSSLLLREVIDLS